MSLLCRFGWHAWRWVTASVVTRDGGFVQVRRCDRCRKEECR